MIYANINETIGNTPVVRINKLAPEHVELYVKAEAFNPAASVKDRLALSIIEQAEKSGALSPGQTVVEATSGNTGIGLAMVCAAKGYPLVIVMADSFSVERRRLMRVLGAKVVLTPRAQKAMGMYNKAVELAQANGWFLARQFETAANAMAHEQTTGPEIIADFAQKELTHFVSGFGTGGTLTGVARVLRRESPGTQIILTEPGNAGLVGSGVAQERNQDGSPVSGHTAWQPHVFQGWSPDFIPAVLQEAIDQKYFDELVPVEGPDAINMTHQLAQQEGILTGVSGGGTVLAAVNVAKTAPAGSVILAMLPDTAERYLSTPLFESVEAEMTDEEIAISMSTPTAQMG